MGGGALVTPRACACPEALERRGLRAAPPPHHRPHDGRDHRVWGLGGATPALAGPRGHGTESAQLAAEAREGAGRAGVCSEPLALAGDGCGTEGPRLLSTPPPRAGRALGSALLAGHLFLCAPPASQADSPRHCLPGPPAPGKRKPRRVGARACRPLQWGGHLAQALTAPALDPGRPPSHRPAPPAGGSHGRVRPGCHHSPRGQPEPPRLPGRPAHRLPSIAVRPDLLMPLQTSALRRRGLSPVRPARHLVGRHRPHALGTKLTRSGDQKPNSGPHRRPQPSRVSRELTHLLSSKQPLPGTAPCTHGVLVSSLCFLGPQEQDASDPHWRPDLAGGWCGTR